jgi:hypothetical protein
MSLKKSAFVISINFKNGFFIHNLYELLPILPIYGFKFIKKSPIPYFGIADVIVSLVPSYGKFKTRGIRTNNEIINSKIGFGNSVAIDFQTFNKNVHIKISSSKECKSKFHITGVTSPEMAMIVTEKLINYIEISNNVWKIFFELSLNDRMKLIDYIMSFITKDNSLLKYDDINTIEHLKKVNLEHFNGCVKLMLRLMFEFNTVVDLYKKFCEIAILSIGFNSLFHNQDKIEFESLEIYNGIYYGNVGLSNLLLYHITSVLSSMGYISVFHSIGKCKMIVMIPINIEDSYVFTSKTLNIKGHLFKITEQGFISLYSKGNPDEVLKIGNSLIKVITEIVNSEEYKEKIKLNPPVKIEK